MMSTLKVVAGISPNARVDGSPLLAKDVAKRLAVSGAADRWFGGALCARVIAAIRWS